MTAARDSIKKGLMALIARKDASVFQNLENFTREINKLGSWQNMPEIPALAAGLAERFPWELQKDGSGLVTGRALINLAESLVKKHNITDKLAVWAVEAWAHALGLKLENPTASMAEPAKSATANAVISNTTAPGYAGLMKNSRLGLIFGQDETGAIRVFASWFREEAAQQSAGLAATMVKIETTVDRPLFSAPPAKRKVPASKTVATEKSASVAEQSVSAIDPSAPALKKEIQPQKPVAKRPAPATKPVTKPSTASRPVTVPVASNKVYYGSADSLYNQAVLLLPGNTGRPNVPEALAILNQAAKQGSLDARRAIGLVYLKGVGIQQDLKTAANWLGLAAEGGDAEAQFHLGSLYQCGMGVEFSLEKAKRLLQRAATQGHKEAQVLLNEILQG